MLPNPNHSAKSYSLVIYQRKANRRSIKLGLCLVFLGVLSKTKYSKPLRTFFHPYKFLHTLISPSHLNYIPKCKYSWSRYSITLTPEWQKTVLKLCQYMSLFSPNVKSSYTEWYNKIGYLPVRCKKTPPKHKQKKDDATGHQQQLVVISSSIWRKLQHDDPISSFRYKTVLAQ